jgi:adenine phosphoribosyltransferase
MNREEAIAYLKNTTRSIVDYPRKGIVFRDLTTVFQDRDAFALALELMSGCLMEEGGRVTTYDKLVGIEARGFLLAGAMAGKMGGGVVMMRKPGKLPYRKRRVEYHLEYGEDSLEVHEDAILPGEKIIIVDDLLATGGTAEAACRLVEESGGIVVKVMFLVELPALGGRKKLSRYQVDSIFDFEGA